MRRQFLEVLMFQSTVTVLDIGMYAWSRYIDDLLPLTGATVKTIQANDTNGLNVINQACDYLKENGAVLLIDMSSGQISPILMSFANANGLAVLSFNADSKMYSSVYDTYLYIHSPEIAFLEVIADIVDFENLSSIAVLHDDIFSYEVIPRRILSGKTAYHIYLKINLSIENIRNELFRRIKVLAIENIFIIGRDPNINKILKEAFANGMADKTINWFVIIKDDQLTCDGCKQTTNIVVINGQTDFEGRNKFVSYMKNLDPGYTSAMINVNDAFLFDLMRMVGEVLSPDLNNIKTSDCYARQFTNNETNIQAKQIIDSFKKVSMMGTYGPILFTEEGLLQQVNLKISKYEFRMGSRTNEVLLGFWSHNKGLNTTEGTIIKTRTRKTYSVVVVPYDPPYVYKTSNSTFQGFCIDLLQNIADRVGFDYDLYEVNDTHFGSLQEDGTWDGLVNEVLQKRADIAVGPISVMAERENVVDFTVPFSDPVGLTILMKKPAFQYSLVKFLTVLDGEVWGLIVASFFLFSILLWLFDKFSPFSYQNNPEKRNEKGPAKRIFTLKEGIWFCVTSLTPQGGGEAPRAISGRLVAATWWLYGFLLIAFYTANLAAFLTVNRMETPISSLDDLSKQQNIEYAPLNGSAALIYFQRMKHIEQKFYEIWRKMSLNDSLDPIQRAQLAVWDYPVSDKFEKLWEAMNRSEIPNTYEEAISRVMTGKFAFIGDSTQTRYQALINCEVEEVGEEFSRKPFAFFVQEGSSLRTQLSNAILELANERVLEALDTQWWSENKYRRECPSITDESDGISILNIGGVFLVIAIGTGMSLITLVFEYYWYRYRPSKQSTKYSIDTKVGKDGGTHTGNVSDIEESQSGQSEENGIRNKQAVHTNDAFVYISTGL
ncbi:hypothetical protein ACJMK2_005559 [Sinanodonta woodiana]|uniref:Glutamate receptor ionotropic, kainate 2 n=1 Tax=Sinanodonta woodiana TaxID=1069815 RepID=A0ABD3VRS0_SINWO